ncbi:MAG: DUF1080 domain-containing protein [Planctomycetaceae bacterium]|nr:DUF1080 domain-containing protein [Planctomycetaceae bacterium]
MTTQTQGSPPGWQTIFDGKSLAGWQAVPATSGAAWTVADGILTGRGTHGRSYLQWQGSDNVRNFDLRLQYRFQGKGNSGVNIRATPDPTGRRAWQAYHADFGHAGIGRNILGAWDFHTPGRKEHGVPRGQRLVIDAHDRPTYSHLASEPSIAPDADGWNRVRIVARDNAFEYYLNGRLSAAFTEHLPPGQRLSSGRIQLQIHDPGMLVEFRDIRITVFDSAGPVEP